MKQQTTLGMAFFFFFLELPYNEGNPQKKETELHQNVEQGKGIKKRAIYV